MRHYIYETRTANIEARLIERDKDNDKSVWSITLTSDLKFDENRMIPSGSEFRYEGEFDEDVDEVESYVANRGLQSACGLTDYDVECSLEEIA